MNKKAIELLETITAKTVQGIVEWEMVVSETFRASVGGGLIRITENPNGSIAVVISNPKGGIIFYENFADNSEESRVAAALYQAARGAALQVDETLDRMLQSLSAK